MRDRPLLIPAPAGWLFPLMAAALALLVARDGDAEMPLPQMTRTQQLEFFESRVRPLLASQCYECHGSSRAQSQLRVDHAEFLLRGGERGAAVVPGDPDESLLIEVVSYGNPRLQMPPRSKLSDEQIEILAQWVEMGAPWPDEPLPRIGEDRDGEPAVFDLQARAAAHWAWQPMQATDPPVVADVDWSRSAIDRYILARLEASDLVPAAEADRRTLVRRLHFDLIGLPPTPEQIEAFVNDDEPDAYERLVDRLLASPHFGERWARHWMDLVRYAETRGHEMEPLIPQAYQYRDYLVRAFNDDVPYDRFVIEHIAGDLLEPPRVNEQGWNESILGTGFWFLGEEVHSPVDIRADELERLDNRVDVMTKTFLGMTVSCARCHDHMFDAISAADYHAMLGFLQSAGYRQGRFETMEHNRGVFNALNALRDDARPVLLPKMAEASEPVVHRADDYLMAARDALVAQENIDEYPGNGGAEDPFFSDAVAARIAEIAARRGLDHELVRQWSATLHRARADTDHLLHTFAVVAFDPRAAEDVEHAANVVRGITDRWRGQLERDDQLASPASRTLIDYTDPETPYWYSDGYAWGPRPMRPGDIWLSERADQPIAHLHRRNAAVKDPLWDVLHDRDGTERDHGNLGQWNRYGRILRTPKAELRSGHLWYLIRGSGRAYAVVDQHLVIAGPLHGALLRNYALSDEGDPTEWRWVHHPLTNYRGHRLHVEFSPDQPDSEFAVAMVVDDQQRPPSPGRANRLLLDAMLQRDTLEPIQGLASVYRDVLTHVSARLLDADVNERDTAELAALIVENPQLFFSGAARAGLAEAAEPLVRRQRELRESIRAESSTAPVMLEGNGVDEYLLIRGSPANPSEQPVPRRFLEALTGPDAEPYPDSGSGRLRLAHEMVDPANPLTARVLVNRIWHHLFGRGIVPTVDNFGALGREPAHPELLDHLALQFIDDGWSIKQTIRRIVMSSTYRQASAPGRYDRIDPDNELVHHMPIRRLEGEVIRDAMLAISGRLDAQPSGPSVEVHLTSFMEGRGRPGSGPLDGDGRRSIYTKIRRNFLPPMMLAFDMPIPFSSVGQRQVSNVPAQALTLMNDPFVVEQAERWTRRVFEMDLDADARIERMYLEAFGRSPGGSDFADAANFLRQQTVALGGEADQWATHRGAWTDFAHVLFNVKEFIFIE